MEMSPKPHNPLNPALDLIRRSEPLDLDSPFRRQVLQEPQEEGKIELQGILVEGQETAKNLFRFAEARPDFDVTEETNERYIDSRASTTKETAQEMKLEVPLSLPASDGGKPKPWESKVMFAEELELFPDLHGVDKYTQDTMDDEIDNELIRLAENESREIRFQLSVEQIGGSHQPARLTVPQLKPAERQAPWQDCIVPSIDEFINKAIEAEGRINHLQSDPKDDVDLNWIPVSVKKTSLDFDETIEDKAGYLMKATTRHTCMISSAQMLWRPDRLKLFDEDESDEDEMEAKFLNQEPQPGSLAKQWMSIPKQLALPIAQDIPNPVSGTPHEHLPPLSQSSQSLGITMPPLLGPGSSMKTLQPSEPILPSFWPLSTSFSAAASLEDFLWTRGSRLKKQKLTTYHVPTTAVLDDLEATQESLQSPGRAANYEQGRVLGPATPLLASASLAGTPTPVTRPTALAPKPFPLPLAKPLTSPRTIFLDNCLLRTHRSLVSFLECQAKDSESAELSNSSHVADPTEKKHLTIIYRDLNLTPPHSTASVPTSAAPDLILNPTTCLMLTTLQALTQRSLPGQSRGKNTSTVHNRILGLASIFDIVFVLVSHVITSHHREGGGVAVDGNDSMTWTSFVGFCASLGETTVVRPILVLMMYKAGESKYDVRPSGILPPPATIGTMEKLDLDPVHAWIWSLISSHAFCTTMHLPDLGQTQLMPTLLQEETIWSLFLQRCGLNVFASQAILSALQKDNGVERHGNSEWGLRRFVQMSHDERVGLFGKNGICGTKALVRVNAALNGN
jgi:hypothetical protein